MGVLALMVDPERVLGVGGTSPGWPVLLVWGALLALALAAALAEDFLDGMVGLLRMLLKAI